MDPGLREAAIAFIFTGESTNATESWVAGLTETCWAGADATGATAVMGAGVGTSTTISTSSSGGGSMSSGGSSAISSKVSSAESSTSPMRTSIVFLDFPATSVTTINTTINIVTETTAIKGAARRCSSRRDNLYSRDVRGFENPMNMSTTRRKKPFVSKRSFISLRFKPIASLTSSGVSAIDHAPSRFQREKTLTLKSSFL